MEWISVIVIILIFIATCVWICCGGGRSNEDNEETGDFTNIVRFIKKYLEQHLISSCEISNVDELYYPRRQVLMSDQCYHSTYQEDPPPYDRAIQESTEHKGSPPPEYYSLI